MSSILYLLIMLLCLTAHCASLSLTVINSPQHRYLSPSPPIFISPQTHIYPITIFHHQRTYHHKKGRMGVIKLPQVLFLLFTLILAAKVTQGIKAGELVSQREPSLEDGNEAWKMRNSRRLMIGSTAPTCTYNECRGCKYRCRAEQVPVEGNDPINSPYHYRCVCHR
ncbi:hypothetical protein Fmac_011171 [Flemingia macrophylla]|uniref:Stomagen C-terminal domain-containing protein n=1 Tax=Flemingia macrophylla TaxID=520843 RepID=A0ABD1MNT4_9FABA